jgi:DnaJ-class molecular chaperone
MARNHRVTVSKLPNSDCSACRGMGSVEMTAHFPNGDADFEWPCWQCYGDDVRGTFPKPNSSSEM